MRSTVVLTGTVYFLAPGGRDHTTFITFRDALGGRWAVGKVVLYGREQVFAIRNPLDVPSYDQIPDVSKVDHVTLMAQLMDQSHACGSMTWHSIPTAMRTQSRH